MSVAEAVDRLERAQASGVACEPVRELLDVDHLDTQVDLAYQVQQGVVAGRTRRGARPVGRKIGLTNPKVRAQLRVDRPDFGVLLDDMARTQDEPIDTAPLFAPRIEAEIAFVLGTDLDRPDLTANDVRAATAHVVTAFEIVDSRIADWNITISDTIADNGSSALFVLGSTEVALDELDLATVSMTMTRGNQVVSQGTGADCLGDPLEAVAWLAATARRYGRPLHAGEIVLSGALGPVVTIAAGDTFEAQISGLGGVRATFRGSR